jgi:hypothetical protein
MMTEALELVPPVAETQNPAAEPTQPEVVAPETDTPEQAPDEHADESVRAIKRMERRIQKLTADKYQTRAEANQAKAEAEELRQKLAQYEQQPDPQQITPEKVLPLAQQIAAQMREREKVVDSVRSVMSEGRKIEGFDAACNAVNEEVPFYDERGQPTPFLRVIMERDAPAKVLHYLGTNLDVAAELADMTPTRQAVRLDKIEAELSRPVEQRQSNAPKPVTPVKAGGGGPKDPSSMTDAEFAKWRREQIKARH